MLGVAAGLGLAILGIGARPAAGPRDERGPTVRLALEITWNPAGLPALPRPPSGDATGDPVELELTQGRVIDALAWPARAAGDEPWAKPDAPGTWVLGQGPSGRVRARVEAPLSSSLLVRAGGRATQFALAALIEAPQHTLPQAPVEVRVERLAWDAVEVHLAEGDGTAAPGARVPVALGFNVLTPEPAQVVLRYSADLRPIRGGPSVWRFEAPPELLSTDVLSPPTRVLGVPMPAEEGTYILEVRASWEPPEEGSRLGRWLRRRRGGPSAPIVRRLSLAVVAPARGSEARPSPGLEATAVDGIDLTRARPGRPMASGRSPLARPGQPDWVVPEAALVEPGLRERLWGWVGRGGEAALGPADPSGLAWMALAVRVPHPGRPHRLRLSVAGGPPEALGVALVVPGGAGRRPRVLLDACAGDATGPEAANPTWPFWPDTAEPVLVLVNRSERAAVRVVGVELAELAGDLAPATLVETHPQAARALALNLAAPGDLDRFGGAVDGLPVADTLGAARNLGGYAAHCGASAVVLPDGLADRRVRGRLDGQAAEDPLGPDALDLTLRLLARRGISALIDVPCDGPLPGLPAPESPQALARGLVRLDANGQPDGPAFHLLHPDVRAALKRRLVEAVAPRLGHPNLVGLVVRLGPGPTLLGLPETGLDDATYQSFVKAAFPPADADRLPGVDARAADRFAARAEFVTKTGRTAWLDWRAERLGATYIELAEAVRSAAPGAILAVVTPGLDDGPAGAEARRADRAGLPDDQAWQAVGLDLRRWPSGAAGPVVLRGVGLERDGLGYDLATSPELDAAIAQRPARGLWVGPGAAVSAGGASGVLRLTARPSVGDEPLGHALAVLDPRWVVLGGPALAGREAAVARFARVFRALPSPPEHGPPAPRLASGVAVRSFTAAGRTYLALANDTPYEVLQAAVVHAPAGTPLDDLGRGLRLEPDAVPGGGRNVVLRLPPFGAATVRIGAAEVAVEPGGSYLPALADLEARAEGLSDRLNQAGRAEGLVGPPLPGFEPPGGARPAGSTPPTASIPAPDADAPPMPPAGWSAAGDPANRVALDPARPHTGRAALRLDARALPASVASDAFLPPGGSPLTVRAWLRSDRPEARVRIWVEGEAGGEPLVRQVDVPVGPDWSERLVRVPDLPRGGLDRLRVRFEWLGTTPGTLWIDDLDVTGQGPSEPGRRAQRVLLEALQAYRAKRYADFARLLGSHRVRHAAGASADGSSVLRTGRASDLPPSRRLR
jgi:hypothetical protein